MIDQDSERNEIRLTMVVDPAEVDAGAEFSITVTAASAMSSTFPGKMGRKSPRSSARGSFRVLTGGSTIYLP